MGKKQESDPVVDSEATSDLDEQKATRKLEVEHKTQKLIAQGFDYNGDRFGVTKEDQINMLWLRSAVIDKFLNPPFTVLTLANTTVSLNDETEVQNFYAAAFKFKIVFLDSDKDLKAQIAAAKSEDELNAIVDSR